MEEKLKSFLAKHKKILVPVVLDLLALFLVFWVILPQFTEIPETTSQIKGQNSRITTLNQSLSNIRSASDTEVDENFNTAVRALPTNKEVALIFSALSAAASASNTQLETFSLSVGGIFGRATELTQGVTNAPTITVTARIRGIDSRSMTQFSNELTKRLPLAEIKNISITSDSAYYEVGFFYKPVDTSKIEKQDKVTLLNQSEINLLNQLKEWDKP